MRANYERRITLLGARLEDALQRCIVLASPYGTIRLHKPSNAHAREFVLDLTENGSQRLRWVLTSVESGTELSIARQQSVPWLTTIGQRVPAGPELARTLDLLPRALNLKIVVIGGGTGLYTTLLGLRDRTWNLTAIISGLSRETPRDAKDELGSLPPDDASMCLVALAPDSDETMSLRSLLEHRITEGRWQGTHFGPFFLKALAETRGSMQAGLDVGAKLLGVHGRIVLADDSAETVHEARPAALEAIEEADMVVLAPGHVQGGLATVSRSAIVEALRSTRGSKIVVTKIMTAEGDQDDEPTTSHQLKSITNIIPLAFDVVVANSASFTRQQRAAYAAVGARPVIPDVDLTSAYARTVVTEELVASGHLARHDPKRLGDLLIEIGTQSVVASANPTGGVPVGIAR